MNKPVMPMSSLSLKLPKADGSIEVTCLGTQRGLETRLVPLRGYELELIPAVPLPRSVTPQLLTVPGRLAGAVHTAGTILDRVGAPIAAGFPTRIYYVSYPHNAFDTHVNQADNHARLLTYTSDHISAFLADMARIGRAQDVTVMVFSEFGRRVAENANLGTDHGTAGLSFILGQSVRGGHYGAMPDHLEDSWQKTVSAMPASEMLPVLAYAGFGGLEIDRDAFDDQGAEMLGKIRHLLGKERCVSDDGRHVFFDTGPFTASLRRSLGDDAWQANRNRVDAPPPCCSIHLCGRGHSAGRQEPPRPLFRPPC